MKWRRVRAVARKEFLHILRDARSLTLALALPFVMLMLFGWALSLDVDRIPTIICDHDRTPESRELIRQFSGTPYFNVVGYTDDTRYIDREVDRGKVLLGIVIPESFGSDLSAGREASVQMLFDGSDSNTASIALGYSEALMETYAFNLRSQARARLGGAPLSSLVEPRVRVWYNSDLKSKNYIVPGLIAVILQIIAALLTSLTIAREWETGTMEQLLSTPLRPMELVLGKLSAYFLLGIADLVICLVAGVFVFGVPLRGPLSLLLTASAVFLFGALSWGIFISASTRSQLLAYQLGVLTSFLPSFLLSGFVYAIPNMPVMIRGITHIVPSRYFIALLKADFLKGAGWRLAGTEVGFLVVYAVIVFLVASRRMRQKVA